MKYVEGKGGYASELRRKAVFTILLIMVFATINIDTARGDYADQFQGFNWYNEIFEEEKKERKKAEEQNAPKNAAPALPDYEKNIRSLQKRHREAHRRALDNPTTENILIELRLEREMLRKSKLYGERRVAVALLDSDAVNMKEHSNILHRRVNEELEDRDNVTKLRNLSEKWGLVLQVAANCVHCHAFAPIVLSFAEKYGFQLLAASKDGKDFGGIEGVLDVGQMLKFNPSRLTPILYLIRGDGKEVLPISKGIHSEDQIIQHIKYIDKHITRLFEDERKI
jgi:conjugal transfer pilus assembly protein TraF